MKPNYALQQTGAIEESLVVRQASGICIRASRASHEKAPAAERGR